MFCNAFLDSSLIIWSFQILRITHIDCSRSKGTFLNSPFTEGVIYEIGDSDELTSSEEEMASVYFENSEYRELIANSKNCTFESIASTQTRGRVHNKWVNITGNSDRTSILFNAA